ncbi:LLM class oxidoreductase [uncultured Pelagimonas sp.]|uniref:LLM class oxidoreductase n=1 Tax=uncultured Pelagimonas sp. TaxID=1618102 RepID=UPI0026164AB7|nr:LLM class oxidoreductase [uncultured Pelagimonas sp.]
MKERDMLDQQDNQSFPVLNRAYNTVFQPGRLTVGLVVPIENNAHQAVPKMHDHIERVQLAERLGFTSVWLRDVPFKVPSFGDAGQLFDPFVYLGALAMSTQDIALGVASIVLPLRHPAHVAKAAASVDVLSDGRLLLGVASGDRPEEFPAMGQGFDDRGARFREAMAYIGAMAEDNSVFENTLGRLPGHLDMLPKPSGPRLPMLITGGSQQSPDWVAQHGDGWMTYPRDPVTQGRVISDYRDRVARAGAGQKPVMQSLYVDVLADPNAPPRPIHMGFQSGTTYLLRYLRDIQALGVNHVALNLRFNQSNVETALDQISQEILPDFAQ